MRDGSFIFNGVKSQDINTHSLYVPEITKPQRKFSLDSGDGINGDRIFDKNSYTNGALSMTIGAFNDDKELIDFTLDQADYKPLQIYSDPKFIYFAKLTNTVKWQRESRNDNYYSADLDFTVLPFKRLIESPQKELTAASTITNPCLYPAESNFKVYGSGNIDFKVNDTIVNIKGLTGWIELDAEKQDAYMYDRGLYISKNDNIPIETVFPVVNSGDNIISWTGTVTKVVIETRWQSLV